MTPPHDNPFPARGKPREPNIAAPAAHRDPPEHVASEPAAPRAEGEHPPASACWPTRHPIHPIKVYSVRPADVAERLRGALGLSATHPTPGEAAATFGRTMPPVVHGLDADGWIAWCMVGLLLFGERFPSLAAVRRESKRFAVTLAMLRACGRIGAAARMLGATPKVLRDNLRAAGLYGGTSTALPNSSDSRGGE